MIILQSTQISDHYVVCLKHNVNNILILKRKNNGNFGKKTKKWKHSIPNPTNPAIHSTKRYIYAVTERCAEQHYLMTSPWGPDITWWCICSGKHYTTLRITNWNQRGWPTCDVEKSQTHKSTRFHHCKVSKQAKLISGGGRGRGCME